ncbi:MAG: hypothetical protein COU27_00575 [Candidatus Levybacteria bacterium CG10_big_fil_rev_8_21_14_0_10_36_7]|nr:MAG: hypothetical protein COU27_00575 [Candidatus Levybacteria bacterium CG10_big_fil_rev_8_21_14_0_10_36_7]
MLKASKGQTIIEATIALSAILLTLTAIAITITTGLSNTQFIKNQGLASKYAQQGMEHLRYLRNNDIATFNSYIEGNIYCMAENRSIVVVPGGCQVNISDSFIRSLEFSKSAFECNNSGTKVEVSVNWSSGKCSESNRFCHESKLISCFSDSLGGATL